jgi:hypothetical protein
MADATVIDFGIIKRFVLLQNRFSKLVIKRHKTDHTQISKATSWIKRLNTTIKAEELHNFSSYQTLIMDKDWWSYQAAMKLVEKLVIMSANSC